MSLIPAEVPMSVLSSTPVVEPVSPDLVTERFPRAARHLLGVAWFAISSSLATFVYPRRLL
jgi:hypothetical protein